jgi:DNA modification methylase
MTTKILIGDCREMLRTLGPESINCVVTSPPYFGLRDYGVAGQMGLEPTPDDFVSGLVDVFDDVRRILHGDGTVWLNIGDSYCSTDKWGGGGVTGKQTIAADGSVPSWQVRQRRLPMAGVKPKDLIGIPWRVAFALQAAGWYLRNAIVWAKPNGMPGSQEDRCTSSYEMIFLLSKSAKYWSDFDAIKTPPRESSLVRLAQDVQAQAGSHRATVGAKTNGAMKAVSGADKQRGHGRRHAGFNDRWDQMEKAEQQAKPAMMRDVWFVSPGGYEDAHFAVMPEEIARRCILAGCSEGGMVLDPFLGSGTTGLVADRLGRNCIGIELNPAYAAMAERRIRGDSPLFAEVSNG